MDGETMMDGRLGTRKTSQLVLIKALTANVNAVPMFTSSQSTLHLQRLDLQTPGMFTMSKTLYPNIKHAMESMATPALTLRCRPRAHTELALFSASYVPWELSHLVVAHRYRRRPADPYLHQRYLCHSGYPRWRHPEEQEEEHEEKLVKVLSCLDMEAFNAMAQVRPHHTFHSGASTASPIWEARQDCQEQRHRRLAHSEGLSQTREPDPGLGQQRCIHFEAPVYQVRRAQLKQQVRQDR